MEYEIIYDYCHEDGFEENNCFEFFKGEWNELQEAIKRMKYNGCYNISAVALEE